jgi:hypothetical protein
MSALAEDVRVGKRASFKKYTLSVRIFNNGVQWQSAPPSLNGSASSNAPLWVSIKACNVTSQPDSCISIDEVQHRAVGTDVSLHLLE